MSTRRAVTAEDLEPAEPAGRHEHAFSRTMIHIDIKKLGRFDRVTGDRTASPTAAASAVYLAIDDASLDMSEISKTGGGIHCMARALKRIPA